MYPLFTYQAFIKQATLHNITNLAFRLQPYFPHAGLVSCSVHSKMIRSSILFLLLTLSSQLVSSGSLRDELIELKEHVPIDRLQVLFAEYLIHDPEFRRTIGYIRSEQFSDTWNRFLEVRTVQQLLTYLADAGFPVSEVLALFAKFTGAERPRMMFKRFAVIRKGGLSAFIEDAIKIISTSDAQKVYEQKRKSCPQYKEMVEKLQAAEFKVLLREVIDDPEVKILQEKIKLHGIDLQKLVDMVKSFFGWSSLF
ncbi:protein G12-like [Toxorhynchites rutilus septentrionalis]|uniref:protein G12-like n=1 Tax=Toxorhynchites rutilus septentrionalis TaxID=329112 RepID=UPI00247AC9E5|nr:protein G12-like [Toxorhynchites rutilus septentrionalis]XP_055642906.1 protein G12-like [Toxorhynchites rutilus septentrionalis]